MLNSYMHFIKKVSYLSGSKKPKFFKVTNSPYQRLDHNSYKSGFYQKTSLLKRIEVNKNFEMLTFFPTSI